MVVKTCTTDHYTVVAQIIFPEKMLKNRKQPRTIKTLNSELLVERLRTEEWNSLYSTDDIQAKTNFFINTLQQHITKSTQVRQLPRKYLKRKPWMTKELLRRINEKNKLYLAIIKNPQNAVLERNYKAVRKEVAAEIKIVKQSHYSARLNESGGDSKRLWKTVKEIVGKKVKYGENLVDEFSRDQPVALEPIQLANRFNDYFANVGPRLASKITLTGKPNVKLKGACASSMFLWPTTQTEIESIITKLKPKRSVGPDEIGVDTLKMLKAFISKPLCHIINRAFQIGCCPDGFKQAILVPIHKKGSKTDMSNYRPISLISNVAKVFEHALRDRLTSFLTNEKIVDPSQFGFTQGKNTEDAINKLVTLVYKSLDAGRKSLCVFLDLQKAFDTVDHGALLKKIRTTWNKRRTKKTYCIIFGGQDTTSFDRGGFRGELKDSVRHSTRILDRACHVSAVYE